MRDIGLSDRSQTRRVSELRWTARELKVAVTVLVFWLLLNGTISFGVVATGVLVSAVITLFFSHTLSVLCGARLTPKSILAALLFVGYFLKELLKANLALARLVLTPSLPISPAIVKVRTKLTDPVARLLLANAITLTPGTLTCEIEGAFLYVHWVSARSTDVDAATQDIVAGFESYLEVIYG